MEPPRAHNPITRTLAGIAIAALGAAIAVRLLSTALPGIPRGTIFGCALLALLLPVAVWRRVLPANGPLAASPGTRSHLRRRIMPTLIGALVAVQLVSTLLLIRLTDDELESDASRLAAEARARLQAYQRLNVDSMRALLDQISHDREILDAFVAGDRALLAPLVEHELAHLAEDFGVTHLDVHRPDLTNFIRAHSPADSGGPVDRWTLAEAARTGGFTSGLEPGPLGSFTLRCVFPWEYEGERIGYLELGKEVNQIVGGLGDAEVVMVQKSRGAGQLYRSRSGRLGVEDSWNAYEGVYFPFHDDGRLPRAVLSRVLDRVDELGDEVWHDLVYEDGMVTQVAGVPLNGRDGLPVAELLVTRDITTLAGERRRLALYAGVGLLMLCLLAGATGWSVLSRLERALDDRAERLVAANERMRESETAVRERERRISAILEAEPECVKIIDAECRVVDMNPAGLSLIEVESLDEVRGVSVLELVTPEYHALFREGVARALAGEQVRQEFEIVGCGGTRRWMEQYSVALSDPGGRGQVLAVTRDVSERVRNHRRLLEAKERAERSLREVQDLRRTVDQQSIVSVTDPSGRIVEVNEMFSRVSGYPREEVIGRDHRMLSSGHHPPEFWHEMWRTVMAGRAWRSEVCNRARDGSLFWVDCIIAPFTDAHGRIEKYVSIYTDITDRKLAEERLRQNERQLNEAQRIARLGSWAFAADSGVLEWSDIVYEIFEIEPERFGGTLEAMLDAVHPDDRDAVRRALDEASSDGVACSFKHRLLLPDGRVKHIHQRCEPVLEGRGGAGRFRGTVQDVTEQTRTEVELRVSARTDRLTSLPNRALLQERMEQALARARLQSDYRFAVLFLDLDRFKTVNDSLGHRAGDDLLRAISDRLRGAVRVTDSLSRHARGHTAARLGGDEFVLLLDGIDAPEDSEAIARRLLDVLSRPYKIGNQVVHTSASIGVVTSETPMATAEEVLRNADIAMYEAKAAGKGCHVVFNASMHDRVRERHSMEHELRGAIDGDELRLMYQPIVDLRTGEVQGCEALLRWHNPERGLVPPSDFIPIAEDTGYITTIGEWVLREACRAFAGWRETMGDRAPGGISVNISRVQLMVQGLPEIVRRILDETGVPPRCLLLEVTESAIMRDAEASREMLLALKEVGVRLAIDDFGTGYSSLASLHQFPVDVLKIDRAFVADLRQGRVFIALISAIAQLAHNLGITTVAEGIESVDHVTLLQSLDCDLGQGYLFSRPIEAGRVPGYTPPPLFLGGSGGEAGAA